MKQVARGETTDSEQTAAGRWAVPSSYLLVLGVLRPEVAAHHLELDVKMGQSVKQVHPPRRGIIHDGRHPGPAIASSLPNTQILNRGIC